MGLATLRRHEQAQHGVNNAEVDVPPSSTVSSRLGTMACGPGLGEGLFIFLTAASPSFSHLRVGQVVNHTPRSAHNNVHSLAKKHSLRHHVDSAHQSRAPHMDSRPQRLKLLCYLQHPCSRHQLYGMLPTFIQDGFKIDSRWKCEAQMASSHESLIMIRVYDLFMPLHISCVECR